MSAQKSEILYIECKDGPGAAEARIGRVAYSKSGQTLQYRDKHFRSLNGAGFKSNYYDVESGDEYWISGCKRSGGDALYSAIVEIDEDVREEYWARIRKKPESVGLARFKSIGKYRK